MRNVILITGLFFIILSCGSGKETKTGQIEDVIKKIPEPIHHPAVKKTDLTNGKMQIFDQNEQSNIQQH